MQNFEKSYSKILESAKSEVFKIRTTFKELVTLRLFQSYKGVNFPPLKMSRGVMNNSYVAISNSLLKFAIVPSQY